jgi:hypothetical protein
LVGNPETQFEVELRKPFTTMLIAAAGSAGTDGRTLAARNALAARTGFAADGPAAAVTAGLGTDPNAASAAGRPPGVLLAAVGTRDEALRPAADRGRITGDAELDTDGALPARSRRFSAPRSRDVPPGRESTCGAPAESDPDPTAGPEADTVGESSSPGAAAAIPAAGVPATTTPRAKAAAPTRAARLLTDIGIPRDR